VFTIVFTIHMLLCVVLVGIVLLQQGKGADLGAAFSGGSNSLFGAAGASTVLVRVTTGIAIAFMVTSVILIKLYQGGAGPLTAGRGDALEGSLMQQVVSESADSQAIKKDAAKDDVAATSAVDSTKEGASSNERMLVKEDPSKQGGADQVRANGAPPEKKVVPADTSPVVNKNVNPEVNAVAPATKEKQASAPAPKSK